MSSKYKESTNKDDVLVGDSYEIFPRELTVGQKDYTGLVLGEYVVIEPVFIDDYDSFSPIAGWLCQNTKSFVYKIIPNLALSKMYTKYCSDKLFFGMEYVSNDIVSERLNVERFKVEFLQEVEKEHKKRTDEYSTERYKEYIRDIDKYVQNVSFNLDFFQKLNKNDFENEIARIVSKYHFTEVEDISSYKNCLYLIILDDFNQFYVGKSERSLKNRMRKHWTAKIIPGRHLWNGGFESSRIKFDDFKMFDTTRIFVCEDILGIINDNKAEAEDKRIEITNTFGVERFEEMNALTIAERIVINNCKCLFCLSDRTPLIINEIYSKLEKIYNVSKNDLLIKQYLRLDEPEPYKAMHELNEENE